MRGRSVWPHESRPVFSAVGSAFGAIAPLLSSAFLAPVVRVTLRFGCRWQMKLGEKVLDHRLIFQNASVCKKHKRGCLCVVNNTAPRIVLVF